MRRLIARKGVGGFDDAEAEDRVSAQRSQSGVRSTNASPVVTPQPLNRSTLTDRKSVNFQSQSMRAEGDRAQREDPVLRISDPDRSFAFTPTKSLDWTVLKKSMELQVSLSR
jgi:hypothetical protein